MAPPAPAAPPRSQADAALAGAPAATRGGLLPRRADPYLPRCRRSSSRPGRWRTPCSSVIGFWSTRSSMTCGTRCAARWWSSGAPTAWAPQFDDEPDPGFVGRLGRTLGDLVGVGRPGEKDFIKRVIGVPGDRVRCCDAQGRVTVNGVALDETYVLQDSPLDLPPNAREMPVPSVRRGGGAARSVVRHGRSPTRLAGRPLSGDGADRQRDRAGVCDRLAVRPVGLAAGAGDLRTAGAAGRSTCSRSADAGKL